MMLRIGIGASLIILLAACAPHRQTQPDVRTEQALRQLHRQQVSRIEQWAFKGRILITQGKQAWQAGLRWWQHKDRYQIKLEGPFSQGGLTLNGQRQQVILTDSTGKQYMAKSPEALLMKVAKIQLPVSALRYWIRGLADKRQQIETVRYDSQGRIVYLEQAGWAVRILRYMPFESVTMPAKIFIEHPKLDLRIVITDWSVP